MDEDRFTEVLKQYWGYDSFRGIQLDIIRSIYNGTDTLGLMPTGGGKSITFQVPALLKDGLCIVITPLIALMKDQVYNLRRRGIKAAAIYTGLSREETISTLENCIFGNYKFLYIAPERIGSETFQTKLKHMNVSFITVDEAHCISQWGYDFRPSYLRINDIRKYTPGAPILALTATATPEVVTDIQRVLHFPHECVYRMSFERKNLSYIVRKSENKMEEILYCLRQTQGSTIIYSRSRKQCRELSEELKAHNIPSTFYHAGLTNSEREERQEKWLKDEVRVMVATNAFGMGIDKPDVRLVLHTEMPDSIEAYFQEAGRAGRDGEQANAILIFSNYDKRLLHQRITTTYPEEDKIKTIYEHLCYYYQLAVGDGYGITRELNLAEFCRNFEHYPIHVHNALKILELAGYIEYIEDEEMTSRIHFQIHRDELYQATAWDDENVDKTIRAIMRLYVGVFAEYTYIDEDRIARQCGLQPRNVYLVLKDLNRRRIVDYIPRKHTSYIHFTRSRVETEHIHLSPEIYQDRKQQYINRINTVKEYAAQEETCRSEYFLHYFGETKTKPCGTCDICTSYSDNNPTNSEKKAYTDLIYKQIKEKGALLPYEFNLDHINRTKFYATIQELVSEEYVKINDKGQFYIAITKNPY